jgi:hypothetical protein
VKVPDFAEIAVSARAGIVVSTAEVPKTIRAVTAPRSRLVRTRMAAVVARRGKQVPGKET